ERSVMHHAVQVYSHVPVTPLEGPTPRRVNPSAVFFTIPFRTPVGGNRHGMGLDALDQPGMRRSEYFLRTDALRSGGGDRTFCGAPAGLRPFDLDPRPHFLNAGEERIDHSS